MYLNLFRPAYPVFPVINSDAKPVSFSDPIPHGCTAMCCQQFPALRIFLPSVPANNSLPAAYYYNMTIYFTLTAILSGIYCHMPHQLPIPSPEQWFGILWLGIFIDAIGIVIWAIALQGSEVSSIVNLAYVTPIVSMFLSVIFLKEKIDVYSVLGLALILGGFFFQKKKNLTYVQLSPWTYVRF